MHADELRSSHQTKRLIAAAVRRDPLAVVARLEDQQEKVRQLQAQVRRAESEVKEIGKDRGLIGRELREAQKELKRLRPRKATAPAPQPTAAVQEQVVDETSPAPEPEAGPQLSELSVEEILTRLEEHSTPKWLAAALNRLWYAHGALEQCLVLLVRHAELVPEMTPGQRQLADRIQGTAALEENLERIVPRRADGPAYVPERARVMYCAFSTPAFHSNGYSVRTRGVVTGLRAAGADVFVVARSGYPWDIRNVEGTPTRRRRHVARVDDVEYVHLPEGDLAKMRADDYLQIAADAFVREARLQRPSLIHAASNYLNALPALIAARRLGLPFVYEVRGLWEITEASAKEGWAETERYAWQARMEAYVASQADAVLAITQETKDELIRRGVPGERIEILPNGVDTDTFLPIPRDEQYATTHGIATDVPVIGFAGSFVDYEGLDLLLQAANILRGRKVGFQIALAGGGGVYPELKSYKERNKLGPRVRFVGRRPSEEIPRFLSCVDIVACPRKSLPVTEMVSPLKPLEAYAASKPVVLSDVSPHRVLAGEDQQRGLLFEPGSPKALADALQVLIEDAELRTAKGRAGRLWAVDERQWSTLGRQIRRVYAQASASALREAPEGRAISDLRIGLIADEFTTKTLQRAARIVVLERDGFEAQLHEADLDLVLLESAWSGNDGQWHRGVGFYSEEEDESIACLLRQCRDLGIPTLFWNKEDPVHIQRFRRTGARTDHVFTTDADMIGEYLKEAHALADGAAVTASSMPFYADPSVHNPLPSARPYEDTIAYAGTFYGERYAQRSRQLEQLLRTAQEASEGALAIYDRQLAVEDSPYRFPREFSGAVRGSLPYDEVLNSYKSHIANLNVNSVAESPTMFSRRVVEIAASGGVVMSAWSRGITETFAGQIPNTNNDMYWRAFLSAWTHEPEEHLAEAWLQMRAILRSHTVDTALILMARTAGLPVRGLRLPSWGCDLHPENADRVLAQSVLPRAVRVQDPASEPAQRAQRLGIRVLGPDEQNPSEVDWWAQLPFASARTWAEDLLSATRWGRWEALGSRYLGTETHDGRVIAQPGPAPEDLQGGMIPAAHGTGSVGQALREAPRMLTLTLPRPAQSSPEPTTSDRTHDAAQDDGFGATSAAVAPDAQGVQGAGCVLVAGHDLKFARSWIEHLQAQGVEVLIDEWENHAHHDEQRSLELLARADVVFCEWGLGNAVWYSKHVRPKQRLVVRVHAQELRRPYLSRIRHAAVAQYLFVGELMRDAAVRSHGVPRARTRVIPNIVRAAQLRRPKTEQAAFTLGLVGIVPQVKRLDRAVTVIESLVAQDPRWSLRIKGRRPEDYAWMLKREDEMAWYRDCYRRIEQINETAGRQAVVFDPHGDDMAEWFQGIGYALSVSDLESFHLTLPDGAASGAAPVSLAWPGADRIYPREWLVADLEQMAGRIVELQADEQQRTELIGRAGAFVDARMDEAVVHSALDRSLMNEEITR